MRRTNYVLCGPIYTMRKKKHCVTFFLYRYRKTQQLNLYAVCKRTRNMILQQIGFRASKTILYESPISIVDIDS